MGSKLNLQILQHSLGVDEYGEGEQYRNGFVTGFNSNDYPDIVELVQAGLMIDHGGQEMFGGMHAFTVTPEGIEYVATNSPARPKLPRSKQRYANYLKVADCFESFGDYLRAQ